MSKNNERFYIDGQWVDPLTANVMEVVNPATEQVVGRIGMGTAEDVDSAVQAARRAFSTWSETPRQERLALLHRIIELCEENKEALALAMTQEIGTPISFSRQTHAANAIQNLREAASVLASYEFEGFLAGCLIRREPIGVCGLITPWNWPLNQVTSKLAPALAAGCTVVLKPSEIAPLSTILLVEILHEAGLPNGVFNLVNGDGPTVGAAIASHPEVDMISFTGSTRAGVLVAQAAAPTVKRVCQELGGKSANILLPDVDLEVAVPAGVRRGFTNAGQSCQAPTRMLVHRDQRDQVLALARRTAEAIRIGDPTDPAVQMGPVASRMQFDKIQSMIGKGIEEGATLVCGGPGKPDGANRGHFVRPTVFADVTPGMTIAREEIFGPVLSIMSYDTEDEAIAIANGTNYGLAGYVSGARILDVQRVANRLRAGRIYLNDAPANNKVPFGGYKQSGNGREHGIFGFEEYLEVKAVLGYRTG